MSAHAGEGGDRGLAHLAFVYESPDEFVDAMAPFVRSGLDRGDVVFAATTRANLSALREELGAAAGLVTLEDTHEWQTRPYERLQAFKALVADLPPGSSLSAMGEPVWEGSPAVVRQWARYESILNLALADAPMDFVCLYDGSSLPDEILGYAVQTHPEQVGAGGLTVRCESFVAPEAFGPSPAPPPPDTAVELPREGSELRRALAAYADAAGLNGTRIDALVLAAHEIASNAVRHGGGTTRAIAWVDGDEVVCQIADAGSGIGDPLAGWLPPPADAVGGWGLPIVRQLCDAVEMSQREGDSTVSLYVSRNGRNR